VDTIDPARRSRNMAKVRGKNTGPERLLRSLLHRMGCRFRLHDAKLPGKPDIVLPRRKAVIFAHGCFWHGHAGCRRAALPTTRAEFWAAKIAGNVMRDARVRAALEALGYRCLVIWQCEMKDVESLRQRLRDFLETPAPQKGASRGEPPAKPR
jgi:DNA mismatch endonuclease (patch repair protein)